MTDDMIDKSNQFAFKLGSNKLMAKKYEFGCVSMFVMRNFDCFQFVHNQKCLEL